MDRPHVLQFISRPQYSLTTVLQTDAIESISMSPTRDSWYDNGTSVYIDLNRSWDVIGNTRQSLVSYSIDNVATLIDRTSTGPVEIPTITMATSHILSLRSTAQFFISIQGTTLSGGQTEDGWFDSGSQFAIQGAYERVYLADNPYYVYAIPVGFQILANTTVSSVLWTSSSMTLSFSANHSRVTVYIPNELNLIPTKVLDNGMPLVFSYSPSSALLSFTGSSDFQVIVSRTGGTSFVGSLAVLYPAATTIVVAGILVLGFLRTKKWARKARATAGRGTTCHRPLFSQS